MTNGIGPVNKSAYTAALDGLHSAQQQMLGAVEKIASGDLDALPESFQQLMVAKHSFAANVKMLAVLDETERHLLDIFA